MENSIYIRFYQKKGKIWHSLPVSNDSEKSVDKPEKSTQRNIALFFSSTTTLLWNTFWGAWLYLFSIDHILPIVQKIKSCLQDDAA